MLDQNNGDAKAAIEKVKAIYFEQVGDRKNISCKEAIDLRNFVKTHITNDDQDNSPEQLAWKALYDGLTKELHEKYPETMWKVEPLLEKMENLKLAEYTIKSRLQAKPNDYGYRLLLFMTIIGLVVGWQETNSYLLSICTGVLFFVVALISCIFVINSPGVQSTLALLLYHKFKMEKLSKWLYARALGI